MIKPDKIIKSNRRTISLRFTEEGELVVRAPLFISEKAIDAFIEKHENWIINTRKRIIESNSKIKTYFFVDGEEFLILGKAYKLKTVSSSFIKDGSEVKISSDYLILRSLYKRIAKTVIKNFYIKLAYAVLRNRVDFYIRKYEEIFNEKLSYSEIKLSNARRQLGSCSSKGALNFSWRIIQAPLNEIDYVVVHEVVHLKEKNHKKSFWLKVQKLKPDYKKNIGWFKDNWYQLREFLNEG